MHGARHIEGEIQQSRSRRLRDELITEELIEAGYAELHGRMRRPIRPDIDAYIGLRGQLRVVAAHPLRRDREVADLRRAVAGGHAAAELPGIVWPIEQAALRRVVEKVPLDREIARDGNPAGKTEDRVHCGDRGGFHSGGDVADPTGCETDLLTVDVVPAVVKGRQGAQ